MSVIVTQHELIVFPTELALRRCQQEIAFEKGWVDASGHTTFARLRSLCLPYAKIKGRRMVPAEHLLMRRQVVDTAIGHFSGEGTLGELSPNALANVLDKLLTELSLLPDEAGRIVDWMLDHHRRHKLYQLGTLYSVWRATIKQEGLADTLDVNQALLKLLRGNRNSWPPLLRNCKQVIFKSVRWFNPFEESCISALNQKLKLCIESALPCAHAEVAADKLGQRIHAEIMSEPWAVWAEDLGDALAVDSSDVLQKEDAALRIGFSQSAGAYGEIEDLARRICWTLETQNIDPHRIALIVPNVGSVQDIIPHVFGRFGIPYYFRRGRPVLSSPCVKACFAFLGFSMRPDRDRLIDLVRNPVLRFEEREEVITSLYKLSPRLKLKDLRDSVPRIRPVFEKTVSGSDVLTWLQEIIVFPEDHFNTEALNTLLSALEDFGEQLLPLPELIDLVEELLEDVTIQPQDRHEQGVWVLKADDAVGLEFDLVIFAGLNEGEFPAVPKQDALLSDQERYWLRRSFEEQTHKLPKMALPQADVLFEQQSVMFLSAIGMAREQLICSFQSVDQEGREKGAGEYYRKIWNLAGWPAQAEVCLSLYDEWRIQRLGGENIFSRHRLSQQGKKPEDRQPMPGESFLSIVPFPLCRASDEALQAVTNGGSVEPPSVDCGDAIPLIEHLTSMLKVESERVAFLDTPVNKRESSKYCGQIEGVKEKISAWFDEKKELAPTALESLARCRYIFLLEHVFGLQKPRVADDTPDPIDRGTLIHSILREIYTAIALGQSKIAVPRCWAVKGESGWKLRNKDGVGAIPLAVFNREYKSDYEAFAREVAFRRIKQYTLGNPAVWIAEQEKILEQVLNFVRYDVDTCEDENRFPALFELKFKGASAIDLGTVKVHGQIDRVDLIFAETGALSKVRVLDYKGSSCIRNSQEEYVDEIRHNLNCQLPVYAFASQQYFFNAFNTDKLNRMTEAGYLVYEREYSKIRSLLKKSIVPMDKTGMVESFLATLNDNIKLLKIGDFAVDPLVETYHDYQSICRTQCITVNEINSIE
ncbi:MAG TPA: PD-(D/E)XK nuclease family protein [Pontiella sp.]